MPPGWLRDKMIERYSRPRMKKIWSEENKLDNWLKVELAVCEAWTKLGKVPPKIGRAHV